MNIAKGKTALVTATQAARSSIRIQRWAACKFLSCLGVMLLPGNEHRPRV